MGRRALVRAGALSFVGFVMVTTGIVVLPDPAVGSGSDSPAVRRNEGLAYDARSSRVIMFGGFVSQDWAVTGDTWTWDGVRWRQNHPTHQPIARGGAAMTEAPMGGAVLFGGGLRPSGNTWEDFADTWAREGGHWLVPVAAHLHLSRHNGPPGTAVHLTGHGFGALERLIVRFVDPVNGTIRLQSFKTDATGAFTTKITVPDDASVGAAWISATGWASGQHDRKAFTVT